MSNAVGRGLKLYQDVSEKNEYKRIKTVLSAAPKYLCDVRVVYLYIAAHFLIITSEATTMVLIFKILSLNTNH